LLVSGFSPANAAMMIIFNRRAHLGDEIENDLLTARRYELGNPFLPATPSFKSVALRAH